MKAKASSETQKLIKIFEAVRGIASESEDPFNGFYKGGTEALLKDFESILKRKGVRFAEKGKYAVAAYVWMSPSDGKKPLLVQYGICYDDPMFVGAGQEPEWCLTGFRSIGEALEVLRDRSVFGDYDGSPPRVYSLDDRGIRNPFPNCVGDPDFIRETLSNEADLERMPESLKELYRNALGQAKS